MSTSLLQHLSQDDFFENFDPNVNPDNLEDALHGYIIDWTRNDPSFGRSIPNFSYDKLDQLIGDYVGNSEFAAKASGVINHMGRYPTPDEYSSSIEALYHFWENWKWEQEQGNITAQTVQNTPDTQTAFTIDPPTISAPMNAPQQQTMMLPQSSSSSTATVEPTFNNGAPIVQYPSRTFVPPTINKGKRNRKQANMSDDSSSDDSDSSSSSSSDSSSSDDDSDSSDEEQ